MNTDTDREQTFTAEARRRGEGKASTGSLRPARALKNTRFRFTARRDDEFYVNYTMPTEQGVLSGSVFIRVNQCKVLVLLRAPRLGGEVSLSSNLK